MTGISERSLLRTAIVLVTVLMVFSGCSNEESPATEDPAVTVQQFLAASWETGETVDDYLVKIDPFLSDPALAATRSKLEKNEKIKTLSYEEVEVDKVVLYDGDAAEVHVSYKPVVNSVPLLEDNETEQIVLLLEQVEENWLVSE